MKGVIDIGAHWFEEYEKWKAAGAIHFLLFEPVYANYRYILDNYKGGNVRVLNVALANYNGHSEMYVDPDHQCLSSSLLFPTLHQRDYPNVKFSTKEIVQVRRLDDVDYDRTLYNHIYMTAQGMDLEILKSAENSLENILIIEAQGFRERLYKDSFISDEMIEWLRARDFKLISSIPTGPSRELLRFSR